MAVELPHEQKPCYPLPEAVTVEKRRVTAAGGGLGQDIPVQAVVQESQHRIQGIDLTVPLSDHREATWSRTVAMARLKWQPSGGLQEHATANGVSFRALRAAEEVRLHRKLIQLGFRAPLPRTAKEAAPYYGLAASAIRETIEPSKTVNTYELWALALSRFRMSRAEGRTQKIHDQKIFRLAAQATHAHPRGADIRRLLEQHFNTTYKATFADSVAVARALDEIAKEEERGQRKEHEKAQGEAFSAAVMSQRAREKAAKVAMPFKMAGGSPDYLPPDEHGVPNPTYTNDGKMRIVRPALTVRSHCMRGAKPVMEGDVMRYPDRMLLDQRIFGENLRKRATVLLDGSGSMRLHESQIEELLIRFPAATVAMYSGYPPDHGFLFILADKGRRVAGIPARPGDNIVDFEALCWLAKQPAPRFWISDQNVSGDIGRCHRVCARARVTICQDIPHAIKSATHRNILLSS